MGGFVGPYLFGLLESKAGSSASGFAVILASALMGLALIPVLARALLSDSQSEGSRLLGLSPQ
jgi:hypothetical protein